MKKMSVLVVLLVVVAVFVSIGFGVNAKEKYREYFTLQKTDPAKGEQFLPPLESGKKWKLIWGDEFDGNQIDAAKWTIQGDSVRKAGWWMKECSYLDGKGNLVIVTKKIDDRYATGGISSKGKFEHAYGYYVIKCRFTKCKTHGPALWMNCPEAARVGDEGKDGTEIDVFEKFYDNNRIQHALHWDVSPGEHKTADCQVDVENINEGEHTFSVLWDKEQYIFYVDGQETWRTKYGGISQALAYVIVSDEIRGWNGDIKGVNDLPHYFFVDYVRVYDIIDANEKQ